MSESSLTEITNCHRAESERLGKLSEFAARFSPAFGETKGYDPDVEFPEDLAEARDRALLETFKAIERIAKLSYLDPPKKRPKNDEQKGEVPESQVPQRPIRRAI